MVVVAIVDEAVRMMPTLDVGVRAEVPEYCQLLMSLAFKPSRVPVQS